MKYRRMFNPGATLFFTVVTYQRQPIFEIQNNLDLLADSFRYVVGQHPFSINALVILPDHLHTIWTLPDGDADYPTRWRLIKSYFTRAFARSNLMKRTEAMAKKGEQPVFQRRYWEHTIRDEKDYKNHLDYIHFNPVKHGYSKEPSEWAPSSFHRFVESGYYPQNWGCKSMNGFSIPFDDTL